MLVRRSTVDFRSCSLSGLLAGKLFWNKHTQLWQTDSTTQFISRYRGQLYKCSVIYYWICEHTLYIERSILRELCSWSKSFTKRSFCTKKTCKIHTMEQKFAVRSFNVFDSLFCSSRLHLFDQNYSKNCNIVKSYYKFKITVFC